MTGKQTREVAGVHEKPSFTAIHNEGRGIKEEDDDEADDYDEEGEHKETIAQVSCKTSYCRQTYFYRNRFDLVVSMVADFGRCS